MEQVLIWSSLFVGGFGMFIAGFHFGQRSVRVVGTRTETLQVSERMTTQRTVPEYAETAPGAVFPTNQTLDMTPPPQYAKLVQEMKERGEI